MKLFALHNSRDFGELIAGHLNVPLSAVEERDFEDGEHKARSLESVRNQNVFVIHSLYGDQTQTVNDKLCRLLFFIGALKDASARKVTAIIPYLCYARKDRKTKSRDPVTTKYIARLFEACGTDAIVTMDVHNVQAFQNAFRIPSENLEAARIFARHLASIAQDEELTIMSPDFGGIKRAEQFQKILSKNVRKELPVVFMEKYRSSGVVSGEKIGGDVNGKVVVIVDDLISTGGTMARAASACKKAGAKKIIAMATHGLFTGKAGEALQEPSLHQVVVSDTVPAFRLEQSPAKRKVISLSVAPLFAKAIERMEEGGSVSELLQD
jgi:ribose-phosphate pyrophosphokinase